MEKKYKEAKEKSDVIINRLGKEQFFKKLKKVLVSGELEKKDFNHRSFFHEFFRDVKNWLHFISIEDSKDTIFYARDVLNINRNIPIFKIDTNSINQVNIENIKTKNLVIPFNNFFVDYPIWFIDEEKKEIYFVSGFLVRKVIEEGVEEHIVQYIVSKAIEDGFKHNLVYMSEFKNKMPKSIVLNSQEIKETDFYLKYFTERIYYILLKLFELIQTKKYTTFKKFENGKFFSKDIVYSVDVKSHKRHFYKETNYFKIPFLKESEILKRGYKIDEIVVMENNEIRTNVPYTIIDSSKSKKDVKEKQRIIEFIKKKNFKRELELGNILRRLFPFEIIRHNKQFIKKSKLRLDYFIPKLRLAFEYDGEQHFSESLYNKLYGEGFEKQIKRDSLKNKLCRRKNICLIRIRYDDKMSIRTIKKMIRNKLLVINNGIRIF